MQSRRKFLQQSALAAGSLLASRTMFGAAAPDEVTKLTILHTNDTHSRLEPFPMDGGKNQGLGGVAPRADLIRKIRGEENGIRSLYDSNAALETAQANNVLLLDAGDIFQGTPYFNVYKGEPEIKAMAAMRYDAVTMGNHDFDGGLENLATQLKHANFPVLINNYDLTDTPMEFKTQPYKVFKKGRIKIGVTGVGIDPKGLIPDVLAGNTKYLDPVANLNRVADHLKNTEGCDMVICLSHLGYTYKDEPNKICDIILAKESENVDLIIGGHTHTFLDAPVVQKNASGSDVIINQVGWAGIVLGRLDFELTRLSGKNLAASHTVVIGKKSSE